jgi:hypothetical protein
MYNLIIKHQGEEARLVCATLEEAQNVRRSFVNWGGMGYDIRIEER